MTLGFAPKQLEYIRDSKKRWNLAHGSVRSGKTVATLFRFMHAVHTCPDNDIYIVGHTFDTAYRNVVKLLLESTELANFQPFCTWSGKKLYYKDKTIGILGAKDEGAIGQFHGPTVSLFYCDEMTLYPPSIIEMINTRLSRPHSQGFASMNPKQPDHILHKWIEEADEGSEDKYSLHFTLDDNPFVSENYKKSIKMGCSTLFYKRNYLGLWCIAEGAVFDFFDRDIYVVDEPPTAADYWIAGVDFGMNNPTTCVLIGVSTGQYSQESPQLWIEREYVWDPKLKGRQKTVSELGNDIADFLADYYIRGVYVDPSAVAIKLELQRKGIHVINGNNNVDEGIAIMSSDFQSGRVLICAECKNTIREMEGYVWDYKASERGKDIPVKKDDHCIDALRYVLATHKVTVQQNHLHNNARYVRERFAPVSDKFM